MSAFYSRSLSRILREYTILPFIPKESCIVEHVSSRDERDIGGVEYEKIQWQASGVNFIIIIFRQWRLMNVAAYEECVARQDNRRRNETGSYSREGRGGSWKRTRG